MKRILTLIVAMLAGPMLLGAAANPKPAIPAGTKIDVTLITELSSAADHSGDTFAAQVQDPVFVAGEQLIPAGSMLRGHVTFVKPPGRVKGKAEMRLEADSLTTKDGQAYTFRGELSNGVGSDVKVNGSEGTIKGQGKSKKKAAEESGIGAAAGAGVGAIAAGGTGALYGAGIGALGGLIRTLAKHHKNVVLKTGTQLVFVLTTPGVPTKATPSNGLSAPFICDTCD